MAKISRQTREIINIVIFFVVVGVILTFYVIYPLNRSKAMLGRTDLDNYNPDSVAVNDPAAFIDSSLAVDTFRIEIDINTTLACLYIKPGGDSVTTPLGTVFLIPDQRKDRHSVISLAKKIADSGYAVVTYDQRASGLSSGEYHGEGFYETNDLEEIIPYLVLRERIHRPLIIVGTALGADAGLMAAAEEERIDRVVAIDPYLSTLRYQNLLKQEHGAIWFPFFRTVTWWWYNIRSGYAAPYRKINDIKPVACKTMLLSDPAKINDPEITRIKESSDSNLFVLKQRPDNDHDLHDEIISFIRQP